MRMQIEELEQSLKESSSIIDGYKGGQIILLNRIEELSKELARFEGFRNLRKSHPYRRTNIRI